MGTKKKDASQIVRPIAAYHEKSNVSEKADYLEGSWLKMKVNTLYSAYVAYITTALGLIATFRTAIQAANAGGSGTVSARDAAELNVNIAKDKILSFIQEASDNDRPNGATIIESSDAYVVVRSGSEKDEFEVEHGVISGSFVLYHRPLEGRFAVLFMMSTDNIHWDVADFSHNSKGEVAGCTPGLKYYFKAKTSSAEGKSGWTYVIDIICT